MRLFNAIPPATPAIAAPPATSGVFTFDATFDTFRRVRRTAAGSGLAFEASSVTLSPAFATGPFAEDRLVVLRRVLLEPFVLLVGVRDREVLDEPFLLVDLLVLELLRVERVPLEDRVVWAILLASLGFLASCAIRAGGSSGLPGRITI